MKQLTVLVYRGTGGVLNKAHPRYSEPALIRAGHVGVIGLVEGDKVIGFHPTPEAAEAAGGERPLLEKLGRHEAVPGRLQDDMPSSYERSN